MAEGKDNLVKEESRAESWLRKSQELEKFCTSEYSADQMERIKELVSIKTPIIFYENCKTVSTKIIREVTTEINYLLLNCYICVEDDKVIIPNSFKSNGVSVFIHKDYIDAFLNRN